MTMMFESRRGDEDVVTLSWDADDLSIDEVLPILGVLLDRGNARFEQAIASLTAPAGAAAVEATEQLRAAVTQETPRCRRLVCGHPETDHKIVYTHESSVTGCASCGTTLKCPSYLGPQVRAR